MFHEAIVNYGKLEIESAHVHTSDTNS